MSQFRIPVSASHASRRRSRQRRSGLATGWLLIWSPVFLLGLLLSVEVGNVQLAKVQLDNALEAGALAGVKQWKESGNTSVARLAAFQYARANPVAGDLVLLDLNDGGGGANDNFSPTGEIVLGALTRPMGVPANECTVFEFDPDESPSIGGTGLFASLSVQVLTNADTKNDVSSGNYSFSIFDFSSSNGSLEIASVRLNVATTPAADETPPFFDLRNPPGMGVSTDKNDGIQPIFLGTGVAMFTASPDFSDNSTSATYQINFLGAGADAFQAGAPLGNPSADKFEFGVDTDRVGPDPGNGDNRFADDGGDFLGTTVTVSFQLGGMPVGAITGVMTQVDGETSIVQFVGEEISSGNFGVVTRKTMSVTPIFANLLGLPIGPFEICGEAAAMCESPNGAPQLVRIIPAP